MNLRPAALLLAVALFSLGACKKTPVAPAQPNVVVITVDTLRADHLGCYGFEQARTPRIDALAAQGIRADRAMAAVPITLPSHSTLFTGLYPPKPTPMILPRTSSTETSTFARTSSKRPRPGTGRRSMRSRKVTWVRYRRA